MDHPEERDTDTDGRHCPYCGKMYAGTQGVKIHLGHVSGRGNYPADAAKTYDPDDTPGISGDDRESTSLYNERTETDGTLSDGDATPPMLQMARVYEYVVDLRDKGRMEEAECVKDRLCGPVENEETGARQAILEALLREGRSSISPEAGVDREEDGIYIECQGAAAVLPADDARWLADALELAHEAEDWRKKPEELIAYLRDGADFLDGELSSKRFFLEHEYPCRCLSLTV